MSHDSSAKTKALSQWPLWEVFVWGQPPFDRERTYTIEAKTDTLAAFQGIEMFVDEMETLRDAELKEE